MQRRERYTIVPIMADYFSFSVDGRRRYVRLMLLHTALSFLYR